MRTLSIALVAALAHSTAALAQDTVWEFQETTDPISDQRLFTMVGTNDPTDPFPTWFLLSCNGGRPLVMYRHNQFSPDRSSRITVRADSGEAYSEVWRMGADNDSTASSDRRQVERVVQTMEGSQSRIVMRAEGRTIVFTPDQQMRSGLAAMRRNCLPRR